MTSFFDTTYQAYLLRRRIGGILFLLVCISMLAYGILIKQTVSHIVVRKQLQTEKAELHNELAMLEARYISMTSALTEETAYALGLVEVADIYYVARTPASTVVTVRNN